MAAGGTSRVGVDIGGTFTDAVWLDERTGRYRIAKVETPSDPAEGFRAAVDAAVPPGGAASLRTAVHATTLASNLLLQGKGARTALLTTKGFEDVLEIGNQMRPRPYDLLATKAPPLVPRRLRLGLRERVAWDGSVVEPLHESEIAATLHILEREKIEGVAICFLFAHVNPVHERKARDLLLAKRPDLFISLSSEICPEYREFWRMSTTVVNALIAPALSTYLRRIEALLDARGVHARVYVMRSDGGTMTLEAARTRPAHAIESGPAAGAVAAAEIGRRAGLRNLVSLDMGGTTAKVCVMVGGSPGLVHEYEVGGHTHGRFTGEGYALKVPALDLAEVGAGGGSVARVDPAGALKVGPRSAGAIPGPACYGRGGERPTVTDAYLALGRIGPETFLGGHMKLRSDASRRAIHRDVADPLGMEIEEAAQAILKVAESSMIAALRKVTVSRGRDPRDFALVAFGGAGPTQALSLAREAGIRSVVIPPHPGVTSALGLLMTNLRYEFADTLLLGLDEIEPRDLSRRFRILEERAVRALRQDGVPAPRVRIYRTADARYRGQAYELNIPVPGGRLGPQALNTLAGRFHRAHRRTYGQASPDERMDLVVLRVVGIGILSQPIWRRIPRGREEVSARKEVREVYFERAGNLRTAVYARERLLAGMVLRGPAIVEQADTTTVVEPGVEASVDGLGNLIAAIPS